MDYTDATLKLITQLSNIVNTVIDRVKLLEDRVSKLEKLEEPLKKVMNGGK